MSEMLFCKRFPCRSVQFDSLDVFLVFFWHHSMKNPKRSAVSEIFPQHVLKFIS